MKSNSIIRFAALLLAAFTLLFTVSACDGIGKSAETTTPVESPALSGDGSEETGAATLPALWDGATHKENKTFGEGAKQFEIEIIADGFSVTFTVRSDAEFIGSALLSNGIITGEDGPYGLYITAVNGICADYDKDKAYWAISKGGEYLMTGVDTTPIENGAHYELTYTKG